MKIYDSLTKIKQSIDENQINIYNCGPTVYNDIHIGNARPLIIFDVLYRVLLANGKQVKYLHNLTDIDDKIIKVSAEKNMSELELSEIYAKAYAVVREQLNTLPLIIQKVSDNMQGIIDYIGQQIANKTAYEINGNVYFDTMSVPTYGCLSNRILEEQNIGERITKDVDKKNETDFILWKKTNVGLQWKSPWSIGRPGWHTECVYLIDKFFGNTLTIHGGGVDLKFPHHENENAQHEGLHKCGLAKIWMHVGHVNVDHEKMSKSLNNFVLVKEILKTYTYQTLRWFMYKTNYRNPLDYNFEIMNTTAMDIKKIEMTINTTKSILLANDVYKCENVINHAFLSELNDDLNITNAITILYELIKNLNQYVRMKDFDQANVVLNEIVGSLDVLGITFKNLHTVDIIEEIKQYYSYISQKQYDKSDVLREKLSKLGVL